MPLRFYTPLNEEAKVIIFLGGIMNANTKNAIVGMVTGLAAYIPVAYTVDRTLDEIDRLTLKKPARRRKQQKFSEIQQ